MIAGLMCSDTASAAVAEDSELYNRLRNLLKSAGPLQTARTTNTTPLPRAALERMFRMFVNGTVGNGSGDEPLDFSDLIDSRGEASRTGVVVVRNKRLHTVTNTFIANLAVSDVLMTCLNIPFNISRVLLDDWPFGGFIAFTMVAIALDRYQVIVKPLKPRLGPRQGAAIIAVIWLLAAVISLPHAVYNEVVTVFTFRALSRCQTRYPRPSRDFRKWLTLLTSLTQVLRAADHHLAWPYSIITRKVWSRVVLGAATEEQMVYQARAKRKTIKMLMVVVVLFAICWMPLNLYHLIVDFSQSTSPTRHNSTLFFFCHWLAMSNVCYNPFIYCWLNEHFRAGALSWFKCLARRSSKVHPAIEINGIPGADVTAARRRLDSQHHVEQPARRLCASARRPVGSTRSPSTATWRSAAGACWPRCWRRAACPTEPEPLAAAPDSPGEPRESGFPLLPRLCEQGKADAYDVICRNIEIFNVSIFAGGETPAAATGGADREPEDSDMVQPVSERVYRGQLTGLLRKQVLNGDGGGGSSGGRRLRETSFALGDPGRTRRSPNRRNSEPEDSDMVQPVSERVYRGQLTGLLRKQVLNGDGGGGSSGGRRLRETSFALGDPGRTRRSPNRRNSSTRSRRSV
ncbi:putative G-protein coupled receptor 83 [Amphibalanus amphitrite]|uniref:Putative G-protein coupled receptor 83 n=1 Tax=Amphibalanus amphitrite TaxID=1232801 RepID=A0A6A4V8I5_AMPAM|nr:putative G-protein coupled receptor 83 [Amphibalanus amphitrite]